MHGSWEVRACPSDELYTVREVRHCVLCCCVRRMTRNSVRGSHLLLACCCLRVPRFHCVCLPAEYALRLRLSRRRRHLGPQLCFPRCVDDGRRPRLQPQPLRQPHCSENTPSLSNRPDSGGGGVSCERRGRSSTKGKKQWPVTGRQARDRDGDGREATPPGHSPLQQHQHYEGGDLNMPAKRCLTFSSSFSSPFLSLASSALMAASVGCSASACWRSSRLPSRSPSSRRAAPRRNSALTCCGLSSSA